MPDPVTWYTLSRTVDDVETIKEAIDAKILSHNQDPSAHGQTGEVVEEHRSDEELDHPAYSIYNIRQNPATRVVKAFVGPAETGDFATIQAAIDYVNLHGGGIVFIKAGTYVLTDHITLYSNIILEGEDMDLTVLDFNNGGYQIKAIGTAASRKRNIEIRNLQIKDSYIYDDFALFFNYCDDCNLTRVKLTLHHYPADPATWALGIYNSNRVVVDGCHVIDNDRGIRLSSSDYCKIERCFIGESDYEAILIADSDYLIFRENLVDDAGTGSIDSIFYIGGTCLDLQIDSNFFLNIRKMCIWNEGASRMSITNNVIVGIGTAGFGIALNDVNRCVIANNRVRDFDYDGINLGADADYNTVLGNVCTNNGRYGINISNVTADKNVVVANCCVLNTTGGVNDAGTNSVVAHNAS